MVSEKRMCDVHPASADIQYVSVIGKSSEGFADVMLAKRLSSPHPLAVRVVMLDDPNVNLAQLELELMVLRNLNHPHCIQMSEAFVSSYRLHIVFPLMDFGSVTDVIHARFTYGLPELASAFILQDVLKALQYLHSRDGIHRSVKCSHILLTSEANGRALLSGFRYATDFLHNDRRLAAVHEFPPNSRCNLLWLAPEVLQQNLLGYGTKSDIYSLGISTCEMANGFPPFSDMEHMQMMLEKLKGTTPHILDAETVGPISEGEMDGLGDAQPIAIEQRNRKLSNHFHNFAELCLKTDPSERPTASELLSHPFFKQLKKHKKTLAELLSPLTPLSAVKLKPSDTQPLVESPAQNSLTPDVQWDF